MSIVLQCGPPYALRLTVGLGTAYDVFGVECILVLLQAGCNGNRLLA